MRRRDFLKTTTAGAAGVTILDGCTGSEEQFIVQRVRQTLALPGESVWAPGICRQCQAACGIQVRVVDGDAKKIEGLEAHPVNRGGVCALGHSLLQELYNPDRLLRARRRADGGELEELAWEEAVAAAVQAVASVPPERIAIVVSERTGLQGALWRRFAAALGAPGPAFLEPPELEVERAAARLALGTNDLPYFDLARAEYVLSIGAPVLDRWRSPVHYTRAFAEMRRARPTRRGRFVQAEPRMSLTAANADEWLPIRPGTEGILARAVAGHVLAEGRVGAVGAQRYRVLFPGAAPSLDEAAAACDVPAERIRRIAEELARAERAVVLGGGSAAAHTNGLHNVTAALGLNLLLDNLGRPGGIFAPVSFSLAEAIAPADRSETSLAELADRLSGTGTPVDLLIVAEADLLHAVPALAESISRVGTLVVLSSFMDDTTLEADLVLPVATELERFEAAEPATSVGVPVLGLANAVVQPMGDGRHPADIMLDIARGLGGGVAAQLPWSSFEALVRERIGAELARLPGSAGQQASAYIAAALERGGIFGEGEPAAAPPGPGGPAPDFAEAEFEGDASEFEFHLLPFESLKLGSGRGANRPWLQEHPDPLSTVMWNAWVELAPADAARLGIHDGDRVALRSPVGSVEALALIDPAVRPGVVGMPMGHGHVDYGRYARGRGANVLALVGRARVVGTSASAWAATRVRLERLGEGRLVRFGRAYRDRGAHEAIPVGWAPHDTSRPMYPREASV